MPRRSAFSSSNTQQPTDTVAMIPVAKNKRGRDWDNNNRARAYYVPRHLEEQALIIRNEIAGIADGMSQFSVWATATDVAIALMERALFKVEKGIIVLETRPDISHKKVGLICVDVEGEAIPQTITRKEKSQAKKQFFLAYRWTDEFDKKIKAHAKQHHILPGEVVVTLLSSALEAYKNGDLNLIPQPITIRQTVAGVWK
jgi:hypothetical protein